MNAEEKAYDEFYPDGSPKFPSVGCDICLEEHARIFGDDVRPWHVVASHFHSMKSDPYRMLGLCPAHAHQLGPMLYRFLRDKEKEEE